MTLATGLRRRYQREVMLQIKIRYHSLESVFYQNFFLADEIDEIIFLNTFRKIERKLRNRIRINLNEVIWYYCGYIISELTSRHENLAIQNNLSNLVRKDMVMIGVSEFMEKIEIDIQRDNSKSYNFLVENPLS
jgi:urease gamma subunit